MSPTAQNEGVTMGPDGTIYAVGEQAAGPSLPGMTIVTPTTSKANVGVGSNLYLTFDQTIMAGAGNVTLSNGAGDTRSIAVTDTSQVTFSGKVMKIHPKYFLVANTTYNVTYAVGVVKATTGNDISAMSGTSGLSFTTIGTLDNTSPTLTSSAPVNGAAGIAGSYFTLFFSESVQAGSGNIVISNGATTQNVSINDTKQVKVNGSRVSITLATPLQNSSSYNVQIASGVVTDLSGNAYAGITNPTTLSFTTAAAGAPAPSILITEVNSNAAGGDFFELYNYGSTPITLTGWKWGDNHADLNDANNTAPFAAGKTIAPGARLVVASVLPSALDAFKSAWGGLTGVDVVAMLNANNDAASSGLGSGDAVIVWDANGNVVATMNYGLTALSATDGSGNLIPVPTASGVTISGHAGAAVGGTAKLSAVWNVVSTASPAYVKAQIGTLGGFAQPSDAAAIGSPGQ
jgi:methionine-rich copper-binding protein CopC